MSREKRGRTLFNLVTIVVIVGQPTYCPVLSILEMGGKSVILFCDHLH